MLKSVFKKKRLEKFNYKKNNFYNIFSSYGLHLSVCLSSICLSIIRLFVYLSVSIYLPSISVIRLSIYHLSIRLSIHHPPVCLSIRLFLSLCRSCLSFIYICLSIYHPSVVCLTICLYLSLSIYRLSVYIYFSSVCVYINNLSVCLSPVCPSTFMFLSVNSSVYLYLIIM